MSMEIKILFFAKLRETFNTGEIEITLTGSNKKVSDLIEALRQKVGIWATELQNNKSFRVAVNQEMVTDDVQLSESDEVAFFPPVTCG